MNKLLTKKLKLLFLLFVCALQWADPLLAADTDRCYLFAYFTDKNQNRDGMHLAWSEDGYNWKPIGESHSFLKCDYGTWYADKKMRDPYLMKGADGLWHCIWTLNWEGDAIGHAASKDLVNWSRQLYPKVMDGYETRNCWAPEMIYDEDKQQYVIFWASTIKENGEWKTEPGEKYDHRMYYTTTKDFKTFTPARILFDPGHNVIDASIQKKEGKYYMLYKDERIYPVAKKELLVAVSESAEGPYIPIEQPAFATDWVEGPAVCPLSDGSFVVYYEAYTKHRYEAKRTTDFVNWEDVSDKISMPESAKHGSFVVTDRAFINNILAEYDAYKVRELKRDERLKYPESEIEDLPLASTLTIHLKESKPISDELFGIFFEDINYAADGGLYAELIQNRDFEYDPEDKTGNDPNWNSRHSWHAFSGTSIDSGCFTIETVNPIHANNPHYARLHVNKPDVYLTNTGFDGIVIEKDQKYNLSLFLRQPEGKKGKLKISLRNPDNQILAETTIKANGTGWQKVEALLKGTAKSDSATFYIQPLTSGVYELDMISLFPDETFKGRKNGLRKDLAQAIADLKPQFVRFPGGCVAHGDGLHNLYQWKNSIGPLEARKPQRNLWGYHQTQGLGYFEYFQFCEDLNAVPVPVVAAGVCCQNSRGGGQQGIPMCELSTYIQDILDLIEYANGDISTTWGKKRAEAGHPEPFGLKYIGVGNEDQITDMFEERFTAIYNVLKEKHPEIIIIGTAGPFNEGTDYVEGWEIVNRLQVPMVDEHYYQTPGWFLNNQSFYDSYSRNGAKVYLGEYAAHLPGRPNNIEVALAEAAYMTSLERNGDIVSMSSYAPLLAKERHTQWTPDMIYFNNSEVKPTINYYVQQLFGQNAGNQYIHATLDRSVSTEAVTKRTPYSVVRDTQTGDLIIKLLNILPETTSMTIRMEDWNGIQKQASVYTLSGDPDESGIKPQVSSIEIAPTFNCSLEPYSLTVIRVSGE